MKNATLGFGIYKIWKIVKHFAGTFHQAKTSFFLKSDLAADLAGNTAKIVYQKCWMQALEVMSNYEKNTFNLKKQA